MRLLMPVVFLILAGATGVARSQPAPGGSEQEARALRLYDEGLAATDRGDFAGGLLLFQQSYALDPQPDTLYNIAMCHKVLADFPAALNAFRDYVAMAGENLSAEERAEYDAFLAEMTPQVGRLAIRGSEAGAEVRIDGMPIGTTPLADWYAVAPGRHRVEVEKPGFEPFSSDVEVAAGDVLRVPATLVAAASATPGDGSPTGGDQEGLSPWFWACVGVAGASAVTMAITGGLTLKFNDDFDAGHRTDADLRDTTIALRTTTDVFLGIGLAAVVAGTVLLLVDPDGEEPADEGPAVAVAPAFGGLAVRW